MIVQENSYLTVLPCLGNATDKKKRTYLPNQCLCYALNTVSKNQETAYVLEGTHNKKAHVDWKKSSPVVHRSVCVFCRSTISVRACVLLSRLSALLFRWLCFLFSLFLWLGLS